MGQWRELVEKNDREFDWLTLQFQVGSWAGYQSDKSGKWNPVAALEVESVFYSSRKRNLANSWRQAVKTSAALHPFGLSQGRVTPWTGQPQMRHNKRRNDLISVIWNLKSSMFPLNLLDLVFYAENIFKSGEGGFKMFDNSRVLSLGFRKSNFCESRPVGFHFY